MTGFALLPSSMGIHFDVDEGYMAGPIVCGQKMPPILVHFIVSYPTNLLRFSVWVFSPPPPTMTISHGFDRGTSHDIPPPSHQCWSNMGQSMTFLDTSHRQMIPVKITSITLWYTMSQCSIFRVLKRIEQFVNSLLFSPRRNASPSTGEGCILILFCMVMVNCFLFLAK